MADTDAVSILAELYYDDPAAALAWLSEAFGFQTRMTVRGDDGRIIFSETGLGGHTVAVAPAGHDLTRSPGSAGGINTQTILITVGFDVDAHCARARAAGAVIRREPETTFAGRFYMAADLEGHLWSFRQRLAGGALPAGIEVEFGAPIGGK